MYERRHEWSLELLRTKVPKILFGSLCYITYPLLSTLDASVRLMPDERVSQYFTQSTIHWYFPLFVSPLPLCHFTHAVVGHLTSWENIYLLYLFYLYRQFTDISSMFKAVAHSRIWGTTQQCSFWFTKYFSSCSSLSDLLVKGLHISVSQTVDQEITTPYIWHGSDKLEEWVLINDFSD